MKNIERFNLYTAHIFGVLYNEFPVPRMLHGREVVTAVRSSLEMSTEEEAKQPKFVSYTLRWLQETGYIKAYGTDENRTFVLEPRAFEAMAAPLRFVEQTLQSGAWVKNSSMWRAVLVESWQQKRVRKSLLSWWDK